MQLERLINILEMTAVAGRPVSVAKIQKATGLPRPTCYRLVQTLVDHRLLDSPETDTRYVIGERLVRLALLGKSDIDVRRASANSIKEAAVRLGESVFLARLRDANVEIIHVEMPDDLSKAFIHPGLGDRPVHACSSAKAIAAFAEEELQESLISGTFEKFTRKSHADREMLLREFSDIQTKGYAECDQEIDLGVSSVAAPVRFGNIGVTFSVGAVGHARNFGKQQRKNLGKQMAQLADKVGAAIQLCNVAEI